MRQADMTERQVGAAENAERRTRHIFWASLVLSLLIVIHITYVARQPGGVLGILQTFLSPVLLWSLTVTAYAFFALSSISQKKQRTPAAFTDIGTGVFNLTYLKSWLAHERKRVLETGQSAVVAYLDLVNLERVNHRFGNTVGDIVLKALAQVIADNVRSGDIVGRVGGDEFLVIMPEAMAAEAQPVVQTITEAIESYRLDLGKRGTIDFVSCKAGLAVFPADGATADEIIAAARSNIGEQPPAE